MSYVNSNHIIAGLDLSLRRTGFTIVNSNGKILHQEFLKTDKMRGMERLFFIRTRILQKLKEHNVSKVVLEGYSYGSKGAAVVSLGELGGVIRFSLFENKYDYLECSPTSLKAYTTGKGNADKDQMRAAVLGKYGIDYTDDNICDSYALVMMNLELGEEMKLFCEKGGATLLRTRKIETLKKDKNKPKYFVELLKLGSAKTSDYKEVLNIYEKFKNKIELYEFLGINQEESPLLEKAPGKGIKVLNKKYSSI